MIRGAGANNPALFKARVLASRYVIAPLRHACADAAARQAMHPSGRLDDVAFLQRELLRVLQEKRALETRCLEAELSLAAALDAAAKAQGKKRV